jgi:hypothetical protein
MPTLPVTKVQGGFLNWGEDYTVSSIWEGNSSWELLPAEPTSASALLDDSTPEQIHLYNLQHVGCICNIYYDNW